MCINRYIMWVRVYSLACITTRDGIHLKTEYLKYTTNPLKISLECSVTLLVGQDKSLWKEEIITITSQNGAFIRPLRKWKIPGHIKQTALLTSATVILYAREATGWRNCTSQTADISTGCNITYIIQS